jgi:hypothetical protein
VSPVTAICDVEARVPLVFFPVVRKFLHTQAALSSEGTVCSWPLDIGFTLGPIDTSVLLAAVHTVGAVNDSSRKAGRWQETPCGSL